jgi:hypothetical protein
MMNVMEKVLAKKKELSAVVSLLFSNFAQTSEKQKKPNLEKIFSLLSKSFEIQAKTRAKDAVLKENRQELVGSMQKTVEADVNGYYTIPFFSRRESSVCTMLGCFSSRL